jgi:hypothetical protein
MEKQKNNSEFISGYKYLISYYKKEMIKINWNTLAN